MCTTRSRLLSQLYVLHHMEQGEVLCAEDVEQELLELWSNVEKEKAARQQCPSGRTGQESGPGAGPAGTQVLRAGSDKAAASQGSGSTTTYEALSLKELPANGTGARAKSECDLKLEPGVDSSEQEPRRPLPSRQKGDAGHDACSTAGAEQSPSGAQPFMLSHSKTAPPQQATGDGHQSGIPQCQQERPWSDTQAACLEGLPQEGALHNWIVSWQNLYQAYTSAIHKEATPVDPLQQVNVRDHSNRLLSVGLQFC